MMFDISALIQTVGYVGLGLLVFAESGLLIGFFLPGDSLLFTAGILASQGHLHILLVYLVSLGGAILGDSVGYAFGRRVAPKIFTKEDSLFFHREHIARAQHFYEKHGAKTLILARFTPIIRTFVPILAGVGSMRYRTFLTYNIIGGILWGLGLPAMGYYLGNTVPNIDHYLIPIIVLIVLISVMPTVIHIIRSKQDRDNIIAGIRKIFSRS